jgi:predicted nucleotidyltransferase
MKLAEANAVTAAVADWAIERADIRAMAMLGSWARGNPRPGSDLDLLLLSDLAAEYQRCSTWLTGIDFRNAGFRPRSSERAVYGVVWSEHVHLLPAAEVELAFAKCSWAGTDPVDAGTRVVVRDAFQIIFDRDGILAKLVDAVRCE